MFRGRPFRRRPLRRPLPPGDPHRRPLPPRVRQALTRANSLMADGQFAEAAAIFGSLSKKAKQRGMLVRAADLALQASLSGNCGAPLLPDEVEWHDVRTAKCPYCGTAVKASWHRK